MAPSPEACERIDEELEKMRLLEPASAEFNVTRAYLDWLTILPWGVYTKDNYDIQHAAKIMACALYSLAINKPIIQNLAMTGELSLTGQVMPIGGVKEKIIAAHRANVKQVILPLENRQDFEKLAPSITRGLTAHFVSNLDEVLKIAFNR